MGNKSKYKESLFPVAVDERFYATIWGEAAGGSAKEIAATTSVLLNRIREEGYEKALEGSSAYITKSPQYLKALKGELNLTEKTKFLFNKAVIDDLVTNPEKVKPYYFMENLADIKKKGDPYWVGEHTDGYQDIDRQRFYYKKE